MGPGVGVFDLRNSERKGRGENQTGAEPAGTGDGASTIGTGSDLAEVSEDRPHGVLSRARPPRIFLGGRRQ
jgi:hypothetical protein